MADCFLVMKNEKQRKKYLILANEIAEKLGNKQFLSMGYSNLTQGALSEGNFREALVYGIKTLDLLKSQPYPVLKMKIDSMMWLAYKGLGQYQQALSSMEAYTKGKDLIVGENQKEQLNKLTLNLAVKEKDLMIANQQIELTDKKRKIEVLTLLVAMIILLATGQFIYVVRTRAFRRELFRKEKELDQFQLDVRSWMEWKKTQDETETEQKALTGELSATDRVDAGMIQVALFNELRDIFDKQKLYLDPEINLNTVIRLLGTNKKYLYQAISENTDANFRNFINRYRIDEAKKMMESKVAANEEINLSEISYAVGFNSHVSFYRAFKTATGLIPSDYLKEIKAQMKR
jgi:AraC-like DNA-binding protein